MWKQPSSEAINGMPLNLNPTPQQRDAAILSELAKTVGGQAAQKVMDLLPGDDVRNAIYRRLRESETEADIQKFVGERLTAPLVNIRGGGVEMPGQVVADKKGQWQIMAAKGDKVVLQPVAGAIEITIPFTQIVGFI